MTAGKHMRIDRRLTFLALASVAACGGPPSPDDARAQDTVFESPKVEAPAGDSVLTATGWGSLRIGMSRAALVAAVGDDANPTAVGGPDPERCDEFRPRGAPAGMIVMIEHGALSRITLVRGASLETDAGIAIGDAAAVVRQAYGTRLQAAKHQYVAPPAEYLTAWETAPTDGPGARGIVYEIDATGRVSRIHAGGPSIAYVEGCV